MMLKQGRRPVCLAIFGAPLPCSSLGLHGEPGRESPFCFSVRKVESGLREIRDWAQATPTRNCSKPISTAHVWFQSLPSPSLWINSFKEATAFWENSSDIGARIITTLTALKSDEIVFPQRWAFLHMFIGHVHTFFGEMCIHPLAIFSWFICVLKLL